MKQTLKSLENFDASSSGEMTQKHFDICDEVKKQKRDTRRNNFLVSFVFTGRFFRVNGLHSLPRNAWQKVLRLKYIPVTPRSVFNSLCVKHFLI